jgi:hypothetical protein
MTLVRLASENDSRMFSWTAPAKTSYTLVKRMSAHQIFFFLSVYETQVKQRLSHEFWNHYISGPDLLPRHPARASSPPASATAAAANPDPHGCRRVLPASTWSHPLPGRRRPRRLELATRLPTSSAESVLPLWLAMSSKLPTTRNP